MPGMYFCAITLNKFYNIPLYQLRSASWGEIIILRNDTIELHFTMTTGDSEQDKIENPVMIIPYGTPSQDIMATCLKLGKGVEECEESVDQVFGTWFYTHYTPTLSFAGLKPGWEKDFSATRGSILSLLSERYNYQRYLEIGTDTDDIFHIAQLKFPVAVGVDPRRGGTLRMTSDEFFATNSELFDLIFIDGLHEANQVLIDVQNALRVLAPGGTIVMHDCNPRGYLHIRASYPLHPYAIWWNGNTWKAAVGLRQLADIEIVIVDIDHGVGVIRKRQNKHSLPTEWESMLGLTAEDVIQSLQNDHLRNNRTDLLRLVTVDGMLDWLNEENNETKDTTYEVESVTTVTINVPVDGN